jgi:hypothetical protein
MRVNGALGTSTSRWASERDSAPLNLLGFEAAAAPAADPGARILAGWVQSYLMRGHAALGRSGHVCPFTARSVRLSLLRIGISPLRGADRAGILQTMQQALRALDAMPADRADRIFRTVIVGFPNCADHSGTAALRDVQNALRHYSILRGKMIGLFEPNSEAEGLINRDFRPLRAPIPALAIRMLVEQDAPFAKRNPLLLPLYLAKFRLAAVRRLLGRASAG